MPHFSPASSVVNVPRQPLSALAPATGGLELSTLNRRYVTASRAAQQNNDDIPSDLHLVAQHKNVRARGNFTTHLVPFSFSFFFLFFR